MPNKEAPESRKPEVKVKIGKAWSEKGEVVRKEKDEKSEKIKKPAVKLRQEFDLGEHKVLPEDKVKEGYVSVATGSVDITPFSEKGKAESFYLNEVTQPCELLLKLYGNNEKVFTPGAIAFIKSNAKVLEAIKVAKPTNKADFAKIAKNFAAEQINGPDGVLNLLLAFNRVVSKLQIGVVNKMTNSQSEQRFKIDLRHRESRSVEVTLYNPEIRDPDIGRVKVDVSGLEVEKLMKIDGTFEVNYWENNKGHPSYTSAGKLYPASPASRVLIFQLNINPRTKIVEVVVFKRVGVANVSMTFTDFDAKVKAKPFFLHSL